MLERHMPETPPPSGASLSKLPRSEVSGVTPPPDVGAERTGLPENRTLQITGFNTLFKFYEEANRPLWERLKAGENLSDQERRDAIGYKITLDGIERLTAEPHIAGQSALPHTMPTDEFINTYKTPDGRIRKQREGLVTNHMTSWADREIAAGNEDRALHLSREVVWENSLPYADLHTTPGSISLEDRIRQEAGAFIHDTGEGDEGRNVAGVKIRDSQHSAGSDEHALDDWVTAETEIGGREEYIIDPPLPTDAITFVNPPRVELDPSVEPRDVYIPDRVENGPVRPGRVRGRRPEEEIRQWIVDLRGGVIPVGPVNITNEYRTPATRAIDGTNALGFSGEGAVDKPEGILEDRVVPPWTGEAGVRRGRYGELLPPDRAEKEPDSSGIKTGVIIEGTARSVTDDDKSREKKGDRLRDLMDKIKGTEWGKEIRSRVKRFIPGLPNWKILLVPLVAGGIGLIPDRNSNVSLPEAVRASEPAPLVTELPSGWRDEDVVPLPGGNAVRMPGNIYKPVDNSVAPTGPNLTEITEEPQKPVSEGGKGKGPNTKEVYYRTPGIHYLDGLAKNETALAINPNYQGYTKHHANYGEDAPVGNKFINGTLDDFKEQIRKDYGDDADKIYDKFFANLTEEMRDIIINNNRDVNGKPLPILDQTDPNKILTDKFAGLDLDGWGVTSRLGNAVNGVLGEKRIKPFSLNSPMIAPFIPEGNLYER